MLQVVYLVDVVAVFMNFHRSIDVCPWPRFVLRVDFVRLYLPGIDARERLVVIAELKIARDAQGVDGTRQKARQQRLGVDDRQIPARCRSPLLESGSLTNPPQWRRRRDRLSEACKRPAKRLQLAAQSPRAARK